jgi:hypothetical protein
MSRAAPILGLALLAMWPARAAASPLARIEAIADDPGTFLVHELPLLAARPGGTGLQLLAQVQPVWTAGPVTVGTSIAAQTVQWEPALRPFAGGTLGAVLGVQTRLGLPNGTLAAVAWQREGLWLDLGLSVRSDASWARPSWVAWSATPVLGLGWVPPGSRR